MSLVPAYASSTEEDDSTNTSETEEETVNEM